MKSNKTKWTQEMEQWEKRKESYRKHGFWNITGHQYGFTFINRSNKDFDDYKNGRGNEKSL